MDPCSVCRREAGAGNPSPAAALGAGLVGSRLCIVCMPTPAGPLPPSRPLQTRDALATATLADLNSYTKRFTRLAGPRSGEVDLDAVLHHFDSELLTGRALQRVLEHVGVADVTLVTKGQFLAVAHLVFTVLQRVQERMFEGAGLCSPSPGKSGATGFASPASQHSRARSMDGGEPWSIQASRSARRPGLSGTGPPAGHRRHAHPTVAQLLSLAVAAQEESVGGSTPALSVGSAGGDDGGDEDPPAPVGAELNDWQAFSSSSGDVSSASLDWATGLDAAASPVSSRRPSPGAGGRADLWDAMLDRPRGAEREADGESAAVPPPATQDWQAFQTVSPAKLMLQGLARDTRSAPSSARLTVRRPGMVAGLEPISAEDRQRCEQLYDKKARCGACMGRRFSLPCVPRFGRGLAPTPTAVRQTWKPTGSCPANPQKYAERGGLKRSSAWRLFGKSGIEASPFEQAWRLAGGGDAFLQALDCQVCGCVGVPVCLCVPVCLGVCVCASVSGWQGKEGKEGKCTAEACDAAAVGRDRSAAHFPWSGPCLVKEHCALLRLSPLSSVPAAILPAGAPAALHSTGCHPAAGAVQRGGVWGRDERARGLPFAGQATAAPSVTCG